MQYLRYVCGRRYYLFIFFVFCLLYFIIQIFFVVKRNDETRDSVQFMPIISMTQTSVTKNPAVTAHTMAQKGRLGAKKRVPIQYNPAIIHWKKTPNDTNCHYSVKDDALISVESQNLTNGGKSIFFHETSCRGGINSRQACAIESAARLHPNWQVNILFSSPITEWILKNSSLTKLLQLQNVKVFRIHIAQYGQGTIVEDIIKNRIKESSHPMEHTSDILRLLTLHKYGGVYLDTDSFLIRSLDKLPPNWIGKESNENVAAGAMSFTKDGVGRNLTVAILTEIRDSFKPESWSYNGPQAILRVLNKLCPNAVDAATDCKGFRIFSPEFFYPIYYTEYEKYFENGVIEDNKQSYMHHMWNYLTKDLKIQKYEKYFENGVIEDNKQSYMHHMWNYLTKDLKIQKYSPYARIAKQFCPTIYKMYGDEFGE